MPKDNEVDEKVMPVAWIVTNGGESCEPWLVYERSEVEAHPADCIADPLYSAATVTALEAEVRKQADVLTEARRAIGDHFAPNDCYATGPMTGDEYRDLVQCPACSFIAMYEALTGAGAK